MEVTEITQSTQSTQTTSVASAPVKRARIPKPSKVIARCIQRLEKIVQAAENGTQELKQSRLIEIIILQGKLALALHRDSVSREARTIREAKRVLKSVKTDQTQTPEPTDPDVIRMTRAWQGS